MAGGLWTDPVDVGIEGVPTTLLTNTADNLRCLRKGNGQVSPVAIGISVANLLDIGEQEETFLVSSAGTLRYITNTNRNVGNRIHLIKTSSSAVIYYGANSPPAGSLPIVCDGTSGVSNTWPVGRMITLVLSFTGWHHDYRYVVD